MNKKMLYKTDFKKSISISEKNNFTHTCIDIGQFNKKIKQHLEYTYFGTYKHTKDTYVFENLYKIEDFNFFHNSKKIDPIVTIKNEYSVNVFIDPEYNYVTLCLKDIGMENEKFKKISLSYNENIIEEYGDMLNIIYEQELITIKLDKCLKEYNENKSMITVKAKIKLIELFCPICNDKLFFNIRTIKYRSTTFVSAFLIEEKDKMSLSLLYLSKDVKYKVVWMKSYRDKIVFNKNTLLTYFIKNLDVKGNKALLSRSKNNPKIIRLKDTKYFTDCAYNLLNKMEHKEYMNVIKEFLICRNEYIEKIFGEDYTYAKKDIKAMKDKMPSNINYSDFYILDTIEDIKIKKEISDYNEIYNHLIDKKKYNFNNFYMLSLIEAIKNHNPSFMKKIKGKTDKEILKMLKIRQKDLVHFIPYNINNADIILRKIFTNSKINEIYLKAFDLVSDINHCHKLFNGLIEESSAYYIPTPFKISIYFLKFIRKNMSEKKFVNFLIKSKKYNRWMWEDAYYSYKRIDIKYRNRIDFKSCNDIKDLHDICVRLYLKTIKENKIIPKEDYLENIFKKEYSFNNNIHYSLAKNTHELIDVGDYMNICVGSYDERVLNKESFIIIGYNNEKNPVTCIELIQDRNSLFKVNQVKKKFNALAEKKEKDYLIKELFEKNNIDVKNCYDLDNIY